MGNIGTKRPNLSLVREGNPGHRTKDRLESGLRLPPAAPDEPAWLDHFPVTRPRSSTLAQENSRARARARETWRRVVPVLDAQGLLASIDAEVLTDYCVAVAQLHMANRSIARDGIWAVGDRGPSKNPATTVANQLRTALKFYVVQLGLSPLARDSFGIAGSAATTTDDDDSGSPFDV